MIKLGIIGFSDGNGHPYSWSAIFNGYDPEYMKDCGFPVINTYLGERKFPEDAIAEAQVTHIWTQDKVLSSHIAQAAKIDNVVSDLRDMISEVDAVLLARDDAENHYKYAHPFLEAGIPIYIDKPLAVTGDTANKLLNSQKYDWQLFSCSALKYAAELDPKNINWDHIGELRVIQASIPNKWDKYAVHIIEPVLKFINCEDEIENFNSSNNEKHYVLTVHWKSNISTIFNVLGDAATAIELRIIGTKGVQTLVFKDSFSAFKNTLEVFIKGVKSKRMMIPREETLRVVDLIEKGRGI